MAALKATTSLTGLIVHKQPHKALEILYTRILRVLGSMPESASYRKFTEVTVQDRLSTVRSEPDVTKLEAKFQGVQVEELISQAENELMLARKMLVWKPWEPLLKEAPPNQWRWPI